MKTIEAAYILPIVFAITSLSFIIAFKLHDRAVSYAVSYGILIDQAASLENESYNPKSGLSKKEISNTVYNFFLVSEKPSFLACLSGSSLYLTNTTEKNSTPVYFSNFERCDTIRKESTFIINLLKDKKQ
jgi:hypothetical protein